MICAVCNFDYYPFDIVQEGSICESCQTKIARGKIAPPAPPTLGIHVAEEIQSDDRLA